MNALIPEQLIIRGYVYIPSAKQNYTYRGFLHYPILKSYSTKKINIANVMQNATNGTATDITANCNVSSVENSGIWFNTTSDAAAGKYIYISITLGN